MRIEREQLKLLLVVGVLGVCAYGAWRGTRLIESNYGSPLSDAIDVSDFEQARRLVEMGANVNEDYGAPLVISLRNGNLEFAQYLLDNGADINARRPGQFSALEYNAKNGRRDIVEWLVERGADYTVVAAAFMNDVQTVKQALEEDPELLDRMNAESLPLLHCAIWNLRVEMVVLLLEAGADPNRAVQSPFSFAPESARTFGGRFVLIPSGQYILTLFDEWDSKATVDMAP